MWASLYKRWYRPIHYTLFYVIRNSFVRNLYWYSQFAKRLSVLKLQRLRHLYIFSFSYHNFENTVTDIILLKDMSRKNLSVVQTLKVK